MKKTAELFEQIEKRFVYGEESYAFKKDFGKMLESDDYLNRVEEKIFVRAAVGCLMNLIEDGSVEMSDEYDSFEDLVYHIACMFDDKPVINFLKASDEYSVSV